MTQVGNETPLVQLMKQQELGEAGTVWAVYLPWHLSTCISDLKEMLPSLGHASVAISPMDLSYWR